MISENYDCKLLYCKPRPEKKKRVIHRPRTPWTFPISIWAAYDYSFEGDSEDYLNEVFEYDFKRIAVNNRDGSLLDEILELRPILRPYYRKM